MIGQDHNKLIFESECPSHIIDFLNDYVDSMDQKQIDLNKNIFGNLLYRDIQNIFIPESNANLWGLKTYLEDLSENLLKNNGIHEKCIIPNSYCFGNGEYLDAWVNRYYMSDYTPLHIHFDSIISGVIILKISQNNNTKDNNCRMDGKLQFILPDNGYITTYCPTQSVGKVILFPSWVQHLVYPQKILEERRTLSFNIKIKH
jgi:hypothetical protein